MTDLLPCPFCGGVPLLENMAPDGEGPREWMARCTECGGMQFVATKEETTAAWNRRVNPIRSEPPTEADVERAIKAACSALHSEPCSYPGCECAVMPRVARAAIAALRKDGQSPPNKSPRRRACKDSSLLAFGRAALRKRG